MAEDKWLESQSKSTQTQLYLPVAGPSSSTPELPCMTFHEDEEMSATIHNAEHWKKLATVGHEMLVNYIERYSSRTE